ncbi:F-box domain-containing protein [Dioscorea alata]|uniref:F-box domain-containing protein n=1 Tax=Dioscorea alata TaxID=55571 RepID=A0ACB7UEC4_DIOAL|nr:F-box domain-containing protein [Dioscorea alata]
MDINGNVDHHRDWASFPWIAMINFIANDLNAVDHVRFRSVCSQWRRHTQERQKAPFLILVDLDNRDDTIKTLSFFDIVGKAIIPLRPLASQRVANSYYLGSSRGWIFVGKYTAAQNGNQEQLRIALVNPFTDDIINLPMLSNHPGGRVFLLNSPRNLQSNSHFLIVVYYVDIDNNGQPTAQVNVIELRHENHWTTFLLDQRPNDVIVCDGQLCGNYLGALNLINTETQQLVNHLIFLLPGLLPALSSDPALFLRFFEDLHGRLHLLFTMSYRTSLYCFMGVTVMPLLEDVNVLQLIELILPGSDNFVSNRCLLISEDFSVVSPYGVQSVLINDFYPCRLLLRLSRFWNDGQNQWEPVGWITPDLL